MNIFDAHVSGSLSVSGSAEFSGDLTVLGTINATISGTTSNAITAAYAPNYTLTSSFDDFTSSYTTGSFTGSFSGDGSNLYNIPASGVTGLNLTKIVSGSISASLSPSGFGVNADSNILGSLMVQNGITGSADFNTLVNKPTLVSGSSQIDISNATGYNTFSSSIATTDLNQENRIGNIEVSTSSLNSFTSSINSIIKTKLNNEGVISGSIQVSLTGTTGYGAFSSSLSNDFNYLSSSIAYTDLTQNNRLDAIEITTNSLNDTTSSLLYKVNSIETSTGSLNSFTSSQIIHNNALNSFTSSTFTSLSSIESTTSSLNSFTNSIDTTIKNKINEEGVVSGSSQIILSGTTGFSTVSASLSSLSSSISLTNQNQDSRLTSIESKTGSYAITGSNSFIGDQTITGSVTITQNLTVLGSSSLLIVTSSQLALSSSVISVNIFEPAERFGGLKVYDSGSAAGTASLLWDSLNNKWIYQNVSGSGYSGGMLMMGPRNTGTLGEEVGTITNVIMKGMGGDHISGSNISDDGTKVSINSNTIITGSLVVTSTISSTNITSIESTTSSLNSFTSSIDVTIKNKLNSDGVISGSSQVLNGTGIWSGSAQLPSGVVSGSSQVSYTSLSNIPVGIISSSAQVISSLPTGTVSGSSQISFTGIVDKPTLVSGSSQITFSGISGIPSGLVSGSSQISYTSLSNIPVGIVSSSAQVSFGSISGVPSGLVSGSSQVLLSSGIWSGSAQLPSGVVSGSSQIVYSSISSIPSGIVSGSSQVSYSGLSGIPSGIVSGSSQITLSSTTGFGSYLNQAVLTSSSPTFASLTTTGAVTIGSTNSGQPAMYITRVGGQPTIKGSTANGGDGQIVIDAASNSTNVYLNNYVSGNVYLATGGGTTYMGATLPHSTAAYDLGSSSVRWRTVYTSDLSLSNGIGDYTIVEGENDLFLYNNKQNKVYKFMLQEVNPEDATPKLPE